MENLFKHLPPEVINPLENIVAHELATTFTSSKRQVVDIYPQFLRQMKLKLIINSYSGVSGYCTLYE